MQPSDVSVDIVFRSATISLRSLTAVQQSLEYVSVDFCTSGAMGVRPCPHDERLILGDEVMKSIEHSGRYRATTSSSCPIGHYFSLAFPLG